MVIEPRRVYARPDTADEFTELLDTPADYSGQKGKVVKVNQAETGVEFDDEAGLSTDDKNKLDGIEDGAEVNVKPDWDATSGDAEILNKPAIPAAQQPADWNADTGPTEVLNKPCLLYTSPSPRD